MRKIILIGYMGSGKTTLGRELSKNTQIPFFDLDELIENKSGKTISQLFSDLGEIGFRILEHEVFTAFMESQEDYILSLGGGTPCYANNHLQFQKEGVISIYLKASIEELVKRLQSQQEKRPLIANKSGAEFEEFIAKHLFERSYFYHQAKHTITVDGKSPNVLQAELQLLLA